jgi:type IV secretion system protein VirD4
MSNLIRKVTRYVLPAGVAGVLLGVLLAWHGWWLTGALFILADAGIVALVVWLRWRPGRGTRAQLGRHDRHTARHAGTASWWDLVRSSSGWAMRRQAAVLRPSLAGLRWWSRWRVPLLSYATPLCTVGRRTVWTSCQESTVRIGAPGTGKTAELACRVLDAPGGIVVTSTAADLFELTATLRARRGPVAVFNPSGLGGIPSDLRWSPLAGCRDPETAARRAADLMGPPPPKGSEGERWADQGRRVLAVFLHAAALGGHRIRDVAAWVANADANGKTILTALAESPRAAEMYRAAEQAISLNPRTRDGVMLAAAPALAWVTQPTAALVGDPDGPAQFAVADLIDHAGALYLLGDDNGTLAPLMGALVAEIVHQARAAAASRPAGRLDPGLTLALDEIALTCPIPIDRWMAELRKRNIVAHVAAQGLAQLRQRWTADGASMILTCAAAVLVFGGCKDPGDLDLFSKLAGTRDDKLDRQVPVIPIPMLAGLANHRVMLVRRGMPVALARTPVAWNRRDVRRAAGSRARLLRAAEKAAARGARKASKASKTRAEQPETINA